MPHVHFHHHGGGGGRRNIPKGCLAVTVGQGEERRRFVIPVDYVNHPLFSQLLKGAEEEYGFDQRGPINIPCHVEEFCHVRGLIDKETTSHHQQSHHNHHHHFLCFKSISKGDANSAANGSFATKVTSMATQKGTQIAICE